MPRLTNKEKALQYAEKTGIELNIEFGSPFGLEIWGATANYCMDAFCHTAIIYVGEEYSDKTGKIINTEAGLYGQAFDIMSRMEKCEAVCTCYAE